MIEPILIGIAAWLGAAILFAVLLLVIFGLDHRRQRRRYFREMNEVLAYDAAAARIIGREHLYAQRENAGIQ